MLMKYCKAQGLLNIYYYSDCCNSTVHWWDTQIEKTLDTYSATK